MSNLERRKLPQVKPAEANDMAEDHGTTMNYRFTARSDLDEKVHLVNAPVAAHPSAYTTWCGQPVVDICRDGDPVPPIHEGASGSSSTGGTQVLLKSHGQ